MVENGRENSRKPVIRRKNKKNGGNLTEEKEGGKRQGEAGRRGK